MKLNNLTVIKHNQINVVDSREVAEMADVRHDDLLRKIRSYASILDKNSEDSEKLPSHNFFIESTYINSQNKEQPCYLLTRKGCDMIGNKMTGEKGVLFTAAYVTKFEEMEQTLKEQNKPTCIEDVLISSLQEMKDMRLQLQETKARVETVEQKANEAKEELQGIREVVSINSTDWKKDTATLISKMALKLGGFEHISDLRKESYNLLHQKTGVKLETRLTNKRRRMADEGVCKSKRDKLNYIDIIAEDKKELEVYLGIVKEMAIKYGI